MHLETFVTVLSLWVKEIFKPIRNLDMIFFFFLFLLDAVVSEIFKGDASY